MTGIQAKATPAVGNVGGGLRVLYLTTVVPSGERTGGEIATQNFVTALKELGCAVKVLGYSSIGRPACAGERAVGIRPIESGSAPLAAAGWLIKSLIKGTPYTVEKYVGAEYLATLAEELRADYDIFIIEHSQMGWLINHLPPAAKIILNVQNVENILYRDLAESFRSKCLGPIYKREAVLLKMSEDLWARQVDQVWTLTNSDREYFSNVVGSGEKVTVFELPGPKLNKSTIESSHPLQRDIAIIGTWTWHSNAAGLIWFVQQVLPLLDREITISVAGSGAAGILSGVERIEYLGFVPSAADFVLSSRIICIPATQGGGVQVKAIESLALGMPVVATRTALRGIEDLPEWVYVDDDATAFSKSICRALADGRVNREAGRDWGSKRRRAFNGALKACLNLQTPLSASSERTGA